MIGRLASIGAALLAAAALAGAPGCAHIEAPKGGPVDSIAPVLVTVRPDTNAVLDRWIGPVTFVFDEGLSEEGVEDAVTLSPRLGPVAVDKEGAELRVRPRRGWQTGIIYQVEVAAGLQDRFNNRRTEPIRLVFSTGPAIPDTRATGTVTERVTGLGSVQARVDATRLSDSLVYSTLADSSGHFTFRQVPEGAYRVVAYRDNNRNHRVDPFEPRDSAALTLAVGDTATATLAILMPDTTPPRPGSARITNGWVEIRFDDYLEPEQPLAGKVEVIGPDGAAVALAEVRVGAPPQARDTADADSVPAAAPAQQQPRPGPARDSARADSLPRGPLPAQSLFARPSAPLLPDTIYTVRVRDVQNINGLVGGGEVPLRTPRPAPPPRPSPADSAAAPADSADAAGDSTVVRRRPAPGAQPPAPAPTPPPPAPGTPPQRAMALPAGTRRGG
ncbi:MAG TPA: carboxypeptidase-like regulatory domain-containing protein [Longimicrobium sp.]|nr:carboxypeptidase-like regulatory domain-containing protein [Longimicrobium sp.]